MTSKFELYRMFELAMFFLRFVLCITFVLDKYLPGKKYIEFRMLHERKSWFRPRSLFDQNLDFLVLVALIYSWAYLQYRSCSYDELISLHSVIWLKEIDGFVWKNANEGRRGMTNLDGPPEVNSSIKIFIYLNC